MRVPGFTLLLLFCCTVCAFGSDRSMAQSAGTLPMVALCPDFGADPARNVAAFMLGRTQQDLTRLERIVSYHLAGPPFSGFLDFELAATARLPLAQAVGGEGPLVRFDLAPGLPAELSPFFQLVAESGKEK